MTAVEVSPSNPPSVMVGRSITLTATARHKDGSVASGAVFEWVSRDPTVASVEGGVVTGVNVGTARIHASVGSVSSPDVSVSVTAAPLGRLTVRATPRVGGQTLTVSEPVGSGLQRRYRVDDAAQDVEWGQVCDLKSGWSAFPLEGAITGGEGQHATVVDVTVSGAYARNAGSAVLPAPAVNLWAYPALPATDSGVTFTREGDGVRAKGTVPANTWAVVEVTKRLEAGAYTLTPAGTGINPYPVVLDGDTAVLQPGTGTATLTAGTYTLRISVKGPATVDTLLTPTLTRN